MPGHDIIVIGTSAGGLDALRRLAQGFPPDLPAAVFVVQHLAPHVPSNLPAILARSGALPAEHPTDGQVFEHGHIYVAPPGAHLLLEREHVRLSTGPRENRYRPAIDPLFRSAAVEYGPRVIGVVLTGALDDGTAGLRAIKQCGGIAVTQDPREAYNPSMPESALAVVSVDACLPLAKIPTYLAQMARESAPTEQQNPVSPLLRLEADIDAMRPGTDLAHHHLGAPSLYTCTECKGPLWEIDGGGQLRYRCQVGHAFSSDALMVGQAEAVDVALWTALETLNQRAAIAEQMATRARQNRRVNAARYFEEHAREANRKAQTVRRLLLGGDLRETVINERITPESAADAEVKPTC
jgi:two-component system chemotaxis response regulator CheB